MAACVFAAALCMYCGKWRGVMNSLLKRVTGLGMFLALGLSSAASAAVIGNWDGSARSWNSGPVLVNLMQSRGHTVEADGALTAANLANDTVFVIGEAARAATAQEAADLAAWVNGGGRLLVTVDSGGTGAGSANAILAAIGSSLTFSGGAIEQSNFHDYMLADIGQAPEVKCHFIQSDYPPMGMGEPPIAPATPAMTNAIFAATGVRIREQPWNKAGIIV